MLFASRAITGCMTASPPSVRNSGASSVPSTMRVVAALPLPLPESLVIVNWMVWLSSAVDRGVARGDHVLVDESSDATVNSHATTRSSAG